MNAIVIETTVLCEYGCNTNAHYRLKNGKMCCSENYTKCLNIRKKNSCGLKTAHLEKRRTYTYNYKSAWHKGMRKGKIEDILIEYSVVNNDVVKNILIDELKWEYKCFLCNIFSWRNKKLTLELDHINGSRNDNRKENLRFLCPNCHSQTKNFRGRNINSGKSIYTDEEIIEIIKKSKNIREVLIKLNLAPKGANYNRIKIIIAKNNIAFYKKYVRLTKENGRVA